MRHRGVATLAALGFALAVAGCGGGGGGGGGTPLTKAQYEQHLATDSQAITKAFQPLSTPPTSLSVLASELKVGQEKLRSAARAEGAERAEVVPRAGGRPHRDRRHEEEGLQARRLQLVT